jgi:hypothetical protein
MSRQRTDLFFRRSQTRFNFTSSLAALFFVLRLSRRRGLKASKD